MSQIEIEQSLLATLLELEQAVEGISKVHAKPDLTAIFSKLDRLTDQLTPADPQLLHFLRRKSYQKARQHLQEKLAGAPGPA